MRPEISMCWDGETDDAELTVGGVTLSGHPDDIEDAFAVLVKLRDRADEAEARVKQLVDGMHRLLR